MTHIEIILLAVCCGSLVGINISNIIISIMYAIDEHKEKKRKKAESANIKTFDN